MKPNTERLRGRAWMALIDEVRRDEPRCVMCKARGRVRLFVHVDHIVPLWKGGTNDRSNLQGLCKEHHDDKTNTDAGRRARRTIGADGWPVE